MPIDTSIALGIRPVNLQQADPIEQYSKGLALKGLLGQQELQGLQTQQARKNIEDEDRVSAAYSAAGGDSKVLRSLLQQGGQYKAIQALDKYDLDKREKEAGIASHESTTAKNKFDVAINQIQHGSAILSSAKDQPSYDAARRMIAMNIDPGLASRMPEQYDPAAVQNLMAAGLTRVQQLTDQRAQEGHALTERGQNMTSATAEAGRKTTERGQNMTDARAREAAAETARANQVREEKEKGLTESQGKASGLALRAQTAHDILTNLEDSGTLTPGIIKQGAAAVPLVGGALEMGVNKLPRFMGGPSSDQQRVEQAQRDFVNAALRVESGASINASEFENARKQYFPQPGDSAETIAQKRRARETEIASLKIQSGPGPKPAGRRDMLGGVLTPNPDGSFNYGFNR